MIFILYVFLRHGSLEPAWVQSYCNPIGDDVNPTEIIEHLDVNGFVAGSNLEPFGVSSEGRPIGKLLLTPLHLK